MKKNYFAIGTFIALAAIAFSCNKSADMTTGGGTGPGTPTGFATDSISMTGTRFSPQVDTVHVGHRVHWKNNDGFGHTATSDDGATFASSNVAAGDTTGFTPTTTGTFTYHCAYHQSMGMVGTLIVKP